MKTTFRQIMRDKCQGNLALLVGLETKTVDLANPKDAMKKTLLGQGYLAMDLDGAAKVFDQFWPDDREYTQTDLAKAAGLSSSGITRLITARAIAPSIRDKGRAYADRARLFSRKDLFVGAVLGSFRRLGVAMPHLVRIGSFMQELLAEPQGQPAAATQPTITTEVTAMAGA